MSLSERNTFFHAISKNPEDDLPKLVFADWLEDGNNNEPEFANFIRHCLAVRELPKEPPEAWMPFLRHSWDGDGWQGIWALDPAPQRPSTGITYPPVPNTIYKFTFMNNGGMEGEKIEAYGMFDGKTYRHSERKGLRAYREIFIHFVPDPIPPEKREERKTLEQKIKEFKDSPLWDMYKSEARLIGLINLWELHQSKLKRLAADLPLPIIHSHFSFNLESIRQSTLPNEDQLARYRLLQNLQPPSVYVNPETPIIIDTDNLP